MRRAAVFLIPLIALAGLIGYLRPWAARSSEDPARPRAQENGLAPGGTAEPGPLPPTAGPPAIASPSAPSPGPAAAAQPPPAQAIGQPASPADPAAAFRARYDGWTREQLATATDELKKRVETEQMRLLQERLARGQLVVLRPGDPPPKMDLGPGGKKPVSMGMASTTPDGATESQLTWLPFAEYPDFYAQLAELEWLQQQSK